MTMLWRPETRAERSAAIVDDENSEYGRECKEEAD